MNYLIYKITNIANDKVYIGKTKKYYGNVYFGIEGRLKNHLTCAFTKSKWNDCPRLYNAIRKYGKDNFIIELLETTTEDEINNSEMHYIKIYNSTDANIGYNIALGGGGRSVVNVDEDIRQKISDAQTKKGILNIKPYLKDDIHIGYRVRRRENGQVFQKYFTSTKFTLEQNLTNAQQWIHDIKTNKVDTSVKYNKSNKLPTNISHIKDKINKSLIIGYSVNIMSKGIKFNKSFQSKTNNLTELLNNAIEYKNQISNAK